jgi:hypothetical protein
MTRIISVRPMTTSLLVIPFGPTRQFCSWMGTPVRQNRP